MPTTTTLTSDPNPSTYGQSVTLTATVAGSGPVGPTGSVTFFNGSTNLGSGNLHSEVATLSTAALPGGTNSITAMYNGDSNYAPSTSDPLLQVVNEPAFTHDHTQVFAQPFQLWPIGHLHSHGERRRTRGADRFGDVFQRLDKLGLRKSEFEWRGDTLHGRIAHGRRFHTPYTGDSNYNASTSTPLTQVVNKAATTTALTSSPNPSSYGQSVTFTATVTGDGLMGPTGSVTFFNGTTNLGSGTLHSGVATLSTTALPVGDDSITAAYNGDSNYNASTSTPLTQVVNRGATTTALTSSLDPSTYGQSVTFTATVTGGGPTGPTGSVTFFNDSTILGSANYIQAWQHSLRQRYPRASISSPPRTTVTATTTRAHRPRYRKS